jgi:hypothetical protein
MSAQMAWADFFNTNADVHTQRIFTQRLYYFEHKLSQEQLEKVSITEDLDQPNTTGRKTEYTEGEEEFIDEFDNGDTEEEEIAEAAKMETHQELNRQSINVSEHDDLEASMPNPHNALVNSSEA